MKWVRIDEIWYEVEFDVDPLNHETSLPIGAALEYYPTYGRS